MRLELGSAVRCKDGAAGVLADLVIDPHARRVSHLIVESRGRHALARLVPIALTVPDDGRGSDLGLSCRRRQLHRLPEVHELAYRRLYDVPARDPDWDVGVRDVLTLPDPDFPGLGWEPGDGEPHVGLAYDRIPKGKVELRRASAVTSADGWPLGRVTGLLATADHSITHLLLRRRRLRGPRELMVPIDEVERLDTDAVSLRLTKRQVEVIARSVRHAATVRRSRR